MRKPEVVVVTGASAGVGRATARKLAEAGAHIGLVARGIAGLEEARREVEALGGRALVLPADVSRSEDVEAAAEAVEREFGAIDTWINCPSVTVHSPISMEAAYLGYVYGTLAAISRMLPRDRGKIVQVSSLADRGLPLQSPHGAAEAAIRGFTESLIRELMRDGSRISISMVDEHGKKRSPMSWLGMHRGTLVAVCAFLGIAALAARRRRITRRSASSA